MPSLIWEPSQRGTLHHKRKQTMTVSQLTITLDNFYPAAIASDPSHETARILRELADDIERGSCDQDGKILRDINGAEVGFVCCECDE
jgi:hypothetical protein